MTDLIKREDAIKALTEVLFDEPLYLNSIEKCETFARKTLESIPSAEELIFEDMQKSDIEAKAYAKGFKEGLEARKQGEWIRRDSWSEGIGMGESYGWYFECSVCGDLVKGGLNGAGNFCTNCGARMEGADNEEI